MPKGKSTSTDIVICSCGCGDALSRRQQTRHLRARGPVMAVAQVIETRAYFHEQDTESPEPPRPRKRQRLQTPMLDDDLLRPPEWRERGCTPPPDIVQRDPSPSPSQAPTPLPRNPVVSKVAHEALYVPWTGSVDFHYGDDDIFEDPNDEPAQPTPGPVELSGSGSDSDTDADDENAGSSESDTREVSDIFETNADLNAAEHSERPLPHHTDPQN